MKKLFSFNRQILITFLSLLIFLFSAPCQEKVNIDLILASSLDELSGFLKKIPYGMESEYGFENREDFQKAKLLDPMNIIFPTGEYYDNELVDSTKSVMKSFP